MSKVPFAVVGATNELKTPAGEGGQAQGFLPAISTSIIMTARLLLLSPLSTIYVCVL